MDTGPRKVVFVFTFSLYSLSDNTAKYTMAHRKNEITYKHKGTYVEE